MWLVIPTVSEDAFVEMDGYGVIFTNISSEAVSGINILGYPTDDEIRHFAHLLKPHRRGPGKTDPLKALTMCQ
jgi:hypothetical protein